MIVAYAFSHNQLPGWSLASQLPTYQNTYLEEDGSLVIIPLGFEWSVPANHALLQCAWAWRNRPEHRQLRGKYVHQHKSKQLRQHRKIHIDRIGNRVGWAVGHRKPTPHPRYIIRQLYFITNPSACIWALETP